MAMQIQNAGDISKIFAFLRVLAKGDFSVKPELVDEIIKALIIYAKARNISVNIVSPSGEKIATCAAYGAVAGAAAGYLLAAVPGALAGAVIGAGLGCCAAHLTIQMEIPQDGGTVLVSIQ